MNRGEWKTIDSAPRDGKVILVSDLETFTGPMWWNSKGTNPWIQTGAGIWEAIDGAHTWSEEGGAGPTHWKPYHSTRGAQAT